MLSTISEMDPVLIAAAVIPAVPEPTTTMSTSRLSANS